jgi:16S rRNA (cytosine967-C5)-methyltransferase
MTPDARLQAAFELLAAIDASPRPADGVVSKYLAQRRYIGSKDRRDIVERVYGVLRRRARLEWWIERSGQAVGPRGLLLADLAVSDGMTPEQLDKIFVGNRAPQPLSGAERKLVGALTGKKLFHHDMPVAVKGEYPAWVEPHLLRVFGDRAAAELAAMREEAPLDLRVNTLKATPEQARQALAAEGIHAETTALSPLGLRLPGRVALIQVKAFREGLVEVQDEGSQLAALLTDARPGEAVVDFCAGAGGKTLALAARMENKGRLVACDVSQGRVDRAQDRLRRAGVHNVRRQVLSGEDDKWVKRHAGTFQRVLVDAPCTGTGTWRRNPDAKWRLTPGRLEELTELQGRVLASAARLVVPGGRLVYATCSLLPEENEARIDAFLAARDDFAVVPVAEVWAEVLGTPCPAEGPYLRLSPARHGTDGFFIAVLQRAASVLNPKDPEPTRADDGH